MATTRLMPLHTGKGRTVGQAISDIIDYTKNPQKTDDGRLITSWQCDSRIADAEFLFAKNQYIQKTGRMRGEDDVIAYHLRQSFVPGEITPEEANCLGCELAKRFTKGNHAYIVCTHIDKSHIHNHLCFLCKILFHRQCRFSKGYVAVHELYIAADRRGIFGVSFGNQSGYCQVHEAGKLRKQQNAENHTHFCPDERVGDGYGETRTMAFVPMLSWENPRVDS